VGLGQVIQSGPKERRGGQGGEEEQELRELRELRVES
jgi:hypothetical protein